MNYIWDVLLKAKIQGLNVDNIVFKPATSYSAYMELAFEDLNTRLIEEEKVIEINPYYRFYSIFKDLFNINICEHIELREALFNIIIHALGENDLKQGLCKEEYYRKFMLRDLLEGVFGVSTIEDVKLLNIKETEVLLNALIKLYHVGTSLEIFKHVVKGIFPNSVIYNNQDNKKEILIYIGYKKTQILERKLTLLIELFLHIEFKTYIYWQYHFGIMDLPETMCIDEMVIY